MAHQTLCPLLRTIHILTRRCILTQQRRTLCGSSPLLRAGAAGAMSRPIKMPAQKSIGVSMSQVTETPNDVGLLPDTFIMPTRSNLPSIFSSPRLRYQLEWKRIKLRTKQFGGKPRIKLQKRTILPTAVAYYELVFKAFAEGNMGLLREYCCDGLLASFRARIHARGRDRLEWNLHPDPSSSSRRTPVKARARLVSHSAARLPTEGSGIRQAVVRIDSNQSLTRWDATGQQVPGTGRARSVREYLVLQKVLQAGEESPWSVWGTVDEYKVDDIRNR
ncbi:MAG: hypothetical protein M1825_005323 [Sarcosagium campestre]|nr:MAG: hypothetical protein M1825_005323 [Sarcosagium campestre]